MRSDWRKLALFVLLCVLLSWYSWLLGYATEPGNSGINPLGALLAALLVSAISGWAPLKTFVRRIARVRAHWGIYATAVLLPAGLAVLTIALLPVLGISYPMDEPAGHWKEAVDAFLIMFLFVALGEEPAWRGWLLPWFQERLSPLAASLAVAPFWALWHLPMWGRDLPYDQLAPFLLSVAAACVVLAWLTNRTAGGVLPAMLCHASTNAFGSAYLFNFVAEADKTGMRWINAFLWLVAAVALVILTKGRLAAAADETDATPAVAPA
ncbi:MAG TPA: CPBP family intramembrane glutamic endopeptidase [Sphingomicrobium sp.]